MDLALPEGVTAEADTDVLSTGSNTIIDSGVYQGTVEMVFIDAAASGAKRLNIHFQTKLGLLKVVNYFSNKQGGLTYKDKNTGKEMPLPGFSQMDTFLKVLTGEGLIENAKKAELKKVGIYDFNAKVEVPTEVSVLTAGVGKEIAIGVMKISEEKTTKESGYTEGTGQFRESNEFVKFFNAKSGLTISEMESGKTIPEFLGKWKAKNTGYVKTKKAKIPFAGGAVAGGATPAPTINPFA